jgi:hypothetical protein
MMRSIPILGANATTPSYIALWAGRMERELDHSPQVDY